ncbi:hypothetical protein B7R54_02570 [Subtercola boreus]|uniref:Major facilitator superfamily (MFS) profile domain-containing protein n=1 Tax=Subtercola boreus TaxID=120213 RepID=A0A3E0VFT0_9MICO|nr:MDR family MFS transporter [Subtercola boreus]RFA08230.1 hypothetical protein B7R54_02570 [Subtercola boreus]TQL54876.1 EmrB/QacA subfamily drug resistance transporter [Subtercola boreus]
MSIRPPDTTPALPPKRQRRIVLGLMMGVALSSLDSMVVATALPTIAGDLGGLSQIAWIVIAYAVATTAVIPLYGKLSDVFGRRPIFLLAIILFIVGSVWSGLAQNLPELIGARALQGLGGGGLIGLAQTVIGDVVPPRERGRYQGYIGVVVALMSIIGPSVGGIVTDAFSWRWIFLANLPLGLIAMISTSRVLRGAPQQRVRHSIDYLGSVLLLLFVVPLVLGLFRVPDAGLADPVTIALLGSGVLFLGAFLWRQLVAREPIMSLSLFRLPDFRRASLAGFCVGLATAGITLYFPLLLQTVKGLSAAESGLLFIPQSLSLMAMNLVCGRIISRTGRYKAVLVAGLFTLAASAALLALLPGDAPVWPYVIGIVLFGVGIGCSTPVLMLVVQNAVGPDQLGVATATLAFTRSMGTTLGTAVFGTITTAVLVSRLGSGTDYLSAAPSDVAALPPALRDAVLSGITDAVGAVFAVSIPIGIAAAVLALAIRETPLRARV